MPDANWKPRILTFVCNWCSYAGADLAGGLRQEIPAELRLVRVMCSGRVDPELVLSAFRKGADGVLVLGCHPGDCHYRSGNTTAMRRGVLLPRLLQQLGVAPERFRLDWVAAGEGERFGEVAREMAETVGALGPLQLPGAVNPEEVA